MKMLVLVMVMMMKVKVHSRRQHACEKRLNFRLVVVILKNA